MDALKFSFKTKTLQLSRVEIPEVEEPNDILIKVAYAGICGTDLHILAGEFPCRQSEDITLGHELSGTVVDVGIHVLNFQRGDKVTVDPNNGCQRCPFCHAGKPHFCKTGCTTNTIGIYKDGGWAEYVICPEEQVHKLNPTITLEQAVLTEPISCMVHGWDILTPITVGEKILLIGGGIVGTLWASALHFQGHKLVTISEPSVKRLELMRKLNTNYQLLTPEQLKKQAEADPDKNLFDVVIDCSGSPPAISQGISLLNSGGKFCMFGVAPPSSKIEVSPFDIFWKELKILGVKVNPFTFPKALGLIEAMGNRYMNFHALGVKTFTLNEYEEAIDTLKKGTITKAVFRMLP